MPVARHLPPKGQIQRRIIDTGGLLSFLRLSWPSFEAGQFRENWHHRLICQYLEKVASGEIRRLYIGIPPGGSKTSISGVVFPSWMWVSAPWARVIHTTYGGDLALDAARKNRDLVNSDFYQGVVNGKIRVPYQNTHAAAYFKNNHMGSRFSGSVGGDLTGRHAHHLMGDDLNKAQDALGLSVGAFDKSWEFWTKVLPTRRADPKTTTMTLIGQRLHRDDVPGRWMAKYPDDVVKLVLPMRFDPNHPDLCPDDPRNDPEFNEKCGGLLWPEHMPESVVQELEVTLGPSGSAAQLQQDPLPPGGQLITDEYLSHRYDRLPGILVRTMEQQRNDDHEQTWRIYCDAAFKSKSQARSKLGPDYVVIQVWCRHKGRYYCIDQSRGQWGFRQTKQKLRDMQAAYPWILSMKIEDAANAAALQDDLLENIPGLELMPHGGGCLARVQQVEGVWASGMVQLPASAGWMGGSDGFEAEHLGFDGLGTRHDDQVSCSGLALLDLSQSRGSRYADMMAKIKALGDTA